MAKMLILYWFSSKIVKIYNAIYSIVVCTIKQLVHAIDLLFSLYDVIAHIWFSNVFCVFRIVYGDLGGSSTASVLR